MRTLGDFLAINFKQPRTCTYYRMRSNAQAEVHACIRYIGHAPVIRREAQRAAFTLQQPATARHSASGLEAAPKAHINWKRNLHAAASFLIVVIIVISEFIERHLKPRAPEHQLIHERCHKESRRRTTERSCNRPKQMHTMIRR